MPLTGDVPHDIKAEMKAGKPQDQAVAIAMNKHREVAGHDAVSDQLVKAAARYYKEGHDGKWIKQELKNQFKERNDNLLEAVLMKAKRESGVIGKNDTADPWEEGYKAYLRGDNSTKYKDEADKAREYHAGWLAAKKDKERKDAEPKQPTYDPKALRKDAERMDVTGFKKVRDPAMRSRWLAARRQRIKDAESELKEIKASYKKHPSENKSNDYSIRVLRDRISEAKQEIEADIKVYGPETRGDASEDTRKDATYKVTVKARGMSEKEDTYTIQASSEFEAGIAARKKADKDWGGGGKGGADSWNVLKIVRADAADTKIEGKSVMERLDDMTQQVNSVGQVAKKIVERMDASYDWYVNIEFKKKDGKEGDDEFDVVASSENAALTKAKEMCAKKYPGSTITYWSIQKVRY